MLTTVVPSDQQAAMAAAIASGRGSTQSESKNNETINWVAVWPPEWRSSLPIGAADASMKDDDFQQWLKLGMKLSPAAEARVADQVERDPAGSITEFRNSTPAAQRSALPGMIAGLVNSDPAAAAALLDELPRGEAWAKVAVQLATDWSRFDRAAAETWINTLPPVTAQRLRGQVGNGNVIPR